MQSSPYNLQTAKESGRTNFGNMLCYLKKHPGVCRTILVEKTDRLYRNIKDYDTEIPCVRYSSVRRTSTIWRPAVDADRPLDSWPRAPKGAGLACYPHTHTASHNAFPSRCDSVRRQDRCRPAPRLCSAKRCYPTIRPTPPEASVIWVRNPRTGQCIIAIGC